MAAWIEVNGAAHRYEHRPGTGPVLVLLHELGGALESWDELMLSLPAGLATLRYDMRGAGLSEKVVGDDLRPDLLVQDLAALLAALEISGPVVLVGCALGGGLSLNFAATHPERCAGVIGLSTVLAAAPENYDNIRLRAAKIKSEGVRSEVDNVLAGAYPPALRSPYERFARCRVRWLANDPDSLAATFMLLTKLDESVADGVKCPVLLVAATHDGLYPPALQRALARRLPRAEVEEEATGHFPSVISPELVGGTISRFLERLPQ